MDCSCTSHLNLNTYEYEVQLCMSCQPPQTTGDRLRNVNDFVQMIIDETDRGEKIHLIKELYTYTESQPRLLRKHPSLKRMLHAKAFEFAAYEELRERMRAAIAFLETY